MTRNGIQIISDERNRHLEIEGWDNSHDDKHINGELALVGAYYAMSESQRYSELSMQERENSVPSGFPWESKWWKPTPNNRIKELGKAGALIAAEIDRLLRLDTFNELLEEYGESEFLELKSGDTIKVLHENKDYIINETYPGGYVDMTSTDPYNEDSGLTFHQEFLSVKLGKFVIINPN